MHLDIILRTCDRVDAFTGPRRIVGPKSEVMLASLRSILKGIDSSIPLKLHVVDDHSSAATIHRMEALLARHKRCVPGFEYEMGQVEGEGNGDSLRTCFELARRKGRELIYFVEDDYLHEPDWLRECLAFYPRARQILEQEVILHPYDCPERYGECLVASYILLGERRHWRQIDQSTCTFLLHRSVLEAFWDRYLAMTQYGKDPSVLELNTIHPIYRVVPCFSPIPTLAVHFQYDSTISPFVDYKELWERNRDCPVTSAVDSGDPE